MSLAADPRLAIALTDRNAKRAMLNTLHQQILAANDAFTLQTQLAKYVALAAAGDRGVANSQQAAREYADMVAMIANMLKRQYEIAKSITANLRA